MTGPAKDAPSVEGLSRVRETLLYFNELMDPTGERFMFDVSKEIALVEAAEARLSALTHAAREYQHATQARLNAPAQPDRWDAYAQAERDLIRALEAQ